MKEQAMQLLAARGFDPNKQVAVERTDNIVPMAISFAAWLFLANIIQSNNELSSVNSSVEENDFQI